MMEHDEKPIRFADLDPAVQKFLNELTEKDVIEIQKAFESAKKLGVLVIFLKFIFWGILGSIISFSAFTEGLSKIIGLFK